MIKNLTPNKFHIPCEEVIGIMAWRSLHFFAVLCTCESVLRRLSSSGGWKLNWVMSTRLGTNYSCSLFGNYRSSPSTLWTLESFPGANWGPPPGQAVVYSENGK